MSHPIYVVDAFTSQRYSGNPAAVCILDQEQSASWMQAVAAEMNLSETAFVRLRNENISLRWFTPRSEVELCGHATLAAAHILWESGRLHPGNPAIFSTLSGLLSATKRGVWITLDFPSLAVEQTSVSRSAITSLGVNPTFVGRSRFDVLVELGSEDEVRAASPNFMSLANESAVRGWIITARADAVEYDFVSRFFAPSVGITEDPVTGSAHCCLGPFWASKLGRSDLTAFQASSRGGTIQVSVTDTRVYLSGQAITTSAGVLL